jgi:hypothetical protein
VKRIEIILPIVSAGVLIFLWSHAAPRHAPARPPIEIGASPVPDSPPAATPSPSASPDPLSAGSPLAAELNAPGGDAGHDVRTLHALLRQYLRILHQYQGPPIGDDIDLARALTGHNPMGLVVIPPGNPALSADGHLRDRWGTPYFIHPIGYGAFEIRSAGPDRKLFTADDAVDGPAGGVEPHTEIPDETPAP